MLLQGNTSQEKNVQQDMIKGNVELTQPKVEQNRDEKAIKRAKKV